MKKWKWMIVPAVVLGAVLVFWTGAVFAQEPAQTNPPVTAGESWTDMEDYCFGIMSGNATGINEDVTGASANFTGMFDYCREEAGEMMGEEAFGDDEAHEGMHEYMMGGGSFGRGMMGGGFGNGLSFRGMMGR